MTEAIIIWTIYALPNDFPTQWIARPYRVERGHTQAEQHYLAADSLEALRAPLPPGLVRLDRMAGDDPVIVEVWL